MKINEEQIYELVERFYSKLTKDAYFSSMFVERGVDIELLKSRQRVFINRLVNVEQEFSHENNVKQVHERHPFQTTPERAEIWLNTMEQTMNEMDLQESVKTTLLEKISFLMKKLIK